MDRSLLHSHGPNLFDLYIEYIKVFYLWLDTKDLDPSNYRQMCSAMEIGPREQRQLVEQMSEKKKQLIVPMKNSSSSLSKQPVSLD